MPVLLFVLLVVIFCAVSVSFLYPPREELTIVHEKYQQRLATKKGIVAALARLVDRFAYRASIYRWRAISALTFVWLVIFLFWLLKI